MLAVETCLIFSNILVTGLMELGEVSLSLRLLSDGFVSAKHDVGHCRGSVVWRQYL